MEKNKKLRYTSVGFVLPVEYNPIFYRYSKPNIRKTLSSFSRDEVIDLIVRLSNECVNKPAINILGLLSQNNYWKNSVFFRMYDYIGYHSSKDRRYCACFNQTLLELLRYVLSIKFCKENFSMYNEYKLEFSFVKVIALLNEQIVNFKIYNSSISELMVTGVELNKDLNNINYADLYKEQLILSFNFFSFLESNTKYAPLLQAFLAKYEIKNWRNYVVTILALVLNANYQTRMLNFKNIKDEDRLINRNIVDLLSFSYSTTVDYKENVDYKFFRQYPIIKMQDDKYIICNVGFLLDKLYNSLYFELKTIAESIESKQKINVSSLITNEFIEKAVFDKFLLKCCGLSNYFYFTETECLEQYKPKDKELGTPDFLLQRKSGKEILLFECKDIILKAELKEQRDFSLLEKELRNKLMLKTYSNGKKCKNPRRIGVGQLAGHIKNIREHEFRWGHDIKSDSIVYPVLVIANHKLMWNGLFNMLNEWYAQSLKNEGVLCSESNKPLIIMSPLCLIKHSKRFKKDGFEKYFEEYYNHSEIQTGTNVDYINKNLTFDDFMDKYPYKLDEMFEIVQKEVLQKRDK